jgi:hypothetical protein
MQFQITAESQARFSRVLRAVTECAQKNTVEMLKQLMVFVAQSAAKLTPIAMRNRRVITATNRNERRAMGGFKYAIETWKAKKNDPKNGVRHFIYTNDKPEMEKMRKIIGRGAAKASWFGIAAKVGANTAIPARLRGAALGNKLFISQDAKTVSITALNFLGYIRKLRPSITTEAVLAAENRFAAYYARKYEAAVKASFDGATPLTANFSVPTEIDKAMLEP